MPQHVSKRPASGTCSDTDSLILPEMLFSLVICRHYVVVVFVLVVVVLVVPQIAVDSRASISCACTTHLAAMPLLRHAQRFLHLPLEIRPWRFFEMSVSAYSI